MKKYMTFIISFILLFSLMVFAIEIVSGLFLTTTYAPDVNEAWHASAALSSQTTIISTEPSYLFILIPALLAGFGAYFIAQKTSKRLHVE